MYIVNKDETQIKLTDNQNQITQMYVHRTEQAIYVSLTHISISYLRCPFN